MYSHPRVVRVIEENFVPVRVHVSQRDEFKRLGDRYGVQWTPTILVLDENGDEAHRIEGFLPVDDFLGQLALGAAHAAFASKQYAEAERRYREVVDTYPGTDAAAEALYWAGVARYKATNDAAALRDTAREFNQRYSDTVWAKKASVWAS